MTFSIVKRFTWELDMKCILPLDEKLRHIKNMRLLVELMKEMSIDHTELKFAIKKA